MDAIQAILTVNGLLLLLTALFAARRLTTWWNLLLVLIFPLIGFLIVLFVDVWRGTAESGKMLAEVTRWPSLFDRAKYGLNVSLVVMFFGGLVLTFFTPAVIALFGAPLGLPPMSVAWVVFVQMLIAAVLFVLLGYLLKKEWVLVLGFGIASAVVAVCAGFLRQVAGEGVLLQQIVTSAGYGLLSGALLMGGLVVATRVGGLKWSSLVLGIVAYRLVYGAIVWVIADPSPPVSMFLNDILAGIVLGTLIHVGLRVHFQGRQPSPAAVPTAAPA